MRGIRPCVTQEEFNSNKGNIDTRGIAKEKVLEGGPTCTNLIESSMYAINPVHYISMISE